MPTPSPLTDELESILQRSERLWDALRGARMFISGGTGFFGIWLLDSLLHANRRLNLGISATILSRDPSGFRRRAPHIADDPAISWLQGDITDFPFPVGGFSHVVHAATEVNAALYDADPLKQYRSITEGTHRTLEFARHAGVDQYLLTSSGAIYGTQPPELENVPEDYRGGPNINEPSSAYAEGKRAAEFMCAVEHSTRRLQPKIARCFAFVGPYLPLDTHFAMGNFMADALAGREIVIKGDGRPYRSYLYAGDLVIWLWTILIKGEANRPYNVGSPNKISIRDLATLIGELAGSPTAVRVCEPLGGGLPSRYVPDTTRAERELGLEVYTDISTSIRKTLNWHRQMRTAPV